MGTRHEGEGEGGSAGHLHGPPSRAPAKASYLLGCLFLLSIQHAQRFPFSPQTQQCRGYRTHTHGIGMTFFMTIVGFLF